MFPNLNKNIYVAARLKNVTLLLLNMFSIT